MNPKLQFATFNMINLDDTKKVLEIQGGDKVIKSVDYFPKQLLVSWQESQKITIPQDYQNINAVVVCGMGGSRFPALIIKELFKEEISVPFVVNDDYNLPGFVDKNTLVILSSYSGTTEEVVTCGQKALKKGAKLIGISAGGEVASFLKKLKSPAYVFNPTLNPSGQPRIGVGYAVGGQLGMLTKLGIIRTETKKITAAIKNLETILADLKLDVVKGNNPAKKLAFDLYQKYPYYIVSEFLTGVGNAVANQTNETAKSISSFRVIPELNHHLMEGLKFPDVLKTVAVFVFFYSPLYSSPIQKRFNITRDVVEQNKIKTIWYELKGKNKIEQALELLGLGGYLTMYLSTLYEQDPTIIPYVNYFKKKLKES